MGVYQEMEIGEPFEPLEYMLTPEKVKVYCEVVGDSNPIYDRVEPDGSRLVPPQIFAFDFHTVRNRHGHTHGGLHAKQAFHVQNPAKVGMQIRVEAWLADKYERRGWGPGRRAEAHPDGAIYSEE